jgi:ribonuclease P protein component
VSVAVLGAPTDPPRVAYTVSRAHGSAVARNLTRRRLRSAVRANADLLQGGHGYLFRPLEPLPGRLQADVVAAVADVLRASQGAR